MRNIIFIVAATIVALATPVLAQQTQTQPASVTRTFGDNTVTVTRTPPGVTVEVTNNTTGQTYTRTFTPPPPDHPDGRR